jgi:hypothetical protein
MLVAVVLDSNLLARATGAQSDVIMRLTPVVDLDSRSPRVPLGARVAADAERFAHSTSLTTLQARRQTLSTVLSQRLGCEVCSAAGVPPDPDRPRALAQNLRLQPGLVLHAHAEDPERLDLPSSTKRALSRRMADASSVASRLVGLARGSCSSHLCGSSASVR